MTQVPENRPKDYHTVAEVKLIEGKREIFFTKDCLDSVTVRRKVNGNEEATIAENVHLPYSDSDFFPSGTQLEYEVNTNGAVYNLYVKI